MFPSTFSQQTYLLHESQAFYANVSGEGNYIVFTFGLSSAIARPREL
jgi:hypothetical protein